MRLTPKNKPQTTARYLAAVLSGLLFCGNTFADSVEILIDAAYEENARKTINEIALHVASAAGSENTVGLVVYDEVFQRSTPPMIADDAQTQLIANVVNATTPTQYSNLAVGIEKGRVVGAGAQRDSAFR